MKPPHDLHITQEMYDAACQDRDRWAQQAMEQHQYIRQLEQQIKTLNKHIIDLTKERMMETPMITNYGTLTYIAEQNNDIHDNEHVYVGSEGKNEEKPTSDNVLRTSTDSPIELSSSPIKGRGGYGQRNFFCRITKAAYDKGLAQAVEDELRSACVSAPKLVKSIRTNEALGYLDTQNMSSRDLFNLLNDHFRLPFKERCFMNYRSK